MNYTPPLAARFNSLFLQIATVATAAGIFVADSVTDTEVAVSVLYVAVVLLSVRFSEKRAVILVSCGCMALTILSYLITNTGSTMTGLVNTAISLLAISITTYLALQIKAVKTLAATLVETDLLRDALIGSVSHELRTPLASILGSASILAEIPTFTKDRRIYLLVKGIRDEALQLDSDIQNLLDAARITSQGLRSNRDWTDPTDIINSAVERSRLRYPSHNILIDPSGDLPFLQVDPVLVEQALAQIVSNAAKYSSPATTIRVIAKVEKNEIIISVVDQGAGLTDEEKAKLKERFFRGPRHTGKIPGSGLGIWIANTFIESNAGKLQALSPGEGEGATIKVIFPIPAKSDRDETPVAED